MLRQAVTLAAVLALAACNDAARLLGLPTAADPPASPGATAAAPPDTADGAADPPTVAAAAPASVAAPPAPHPPAAACAEVTADGPAHEVDLEAVRQALHGTDFRRGAFETVGSYKARILPRLEAVEALATAQSGRPALVFSVPIPAYRMAYDANAHELVIGSDLGLLRGGSAIGMGDFVLVASAEHQIGRDLETLGYGGKATATRREVARIRGDQLGVMIPGSTSSGWPASFTRLRVAMTPDEAAAARAALAVLFVGRLEAPYFMTGEFLQEPQVDDPVEKRLLVEAIKVSVDCAALYDRRTGRLLRQIVPAAPAAAAGG